MIPTCPNCGTQYVVKDGAIRRRAARSAARRASKAGTRTRASRKPPAIEGGRNRRLPKVPRLIESASGGGIARPPGAMSATRTAEDDDQAEPRLRPPNRAAGGPRSRAAPPSALAADAEPANGRADWLRSEAEPDVQDDDFARFERGRVERGRGCRGLADPADRRRRGAGALFWFLAPPEWKARLARRAGRAADAGHDPHGPPAAGKRQRVADRHRRVINPTAKNQPFRRHAELRNRAGQSSTAGPSHRRRGPLRRAPARASTAPRSTSRRAAKSDQSPWRGGQRGLSETLGGAIARPGALG